jgi:hypothetical protein
MGATFTQALFHLGPAGFEPASTTASLWDHAISVSRDALRGRILAAQLGVRACLSGPNPIGFAACVAVAGVVRIVLAFVVVVVGDTPWTCKVV